jgi:hypothetical protein
MATMLEPFLDPSAIASPEDKQKLQAGAAKAKQLTNGKILSQAGVKNLYLSERSF